MNVEELKKELRDLGINYTAEMIEKTASFCTYLLEENEKTNLTAIRNLEEVYLKHIYDSLTLVKAVDLHDILTLLDIGTGAGFPGIVVKIFFPHLKVTLLDSNNKKIAFLKSALHYLEINDVEIINERAEDFIKDRREFYDLVTARAVANLRVLSEICLPFAKVNKYFIAMKSNVETEIKESENTIRILGGKLKKTVSLKLPFENSERNLVVIRKINNTNKKYPRTYSQIIKMPLVK